MRFRYPERSRYLAATNKFSNALVLLWKSYTAHTLFARRKTRPV